MQTLIKVILLFLITAIIVQTAELDSNRSKKVLIIYSFHDKLPWQRIFRKSFSYNLSKYGNGIDIYEEKLDAMRFQGAKHREHFYAYILSKYSETKLDAVITESGPASEMLISHISDWRDTRHLFVNPSDNFFKFLSNDSKENILSVHGQLPKAVMELVSVFHPKKIVVVGDTQRDFTKNFIDEIKNLQKKMNMKIDYLLNLPMDKLLTRVSRLEKGTVIFYTLIFKDGEGKTFVPYNAAQMIAKHSSVPVFSHWDSLMGSGIAGGYMISADEVGRMASDDIIKLINGQKIDIAKEGKGGFKHIYDWSILHEYGLSMDNIPDDALIINSNTTIWERYLWWFVWGVLVLIVLIIIVTVWITMLRHQVAKQTKELKIARDRAEKSAVTDRLTGLPNRLALEPIIEQELKRHDRKNIPVTLMMLDIDRFKSINDSYGHNIGDEVLKAFAERLEPMMRVTDILVRWGGEEFIVLAPKTSLEEGVRFADKLRKHIEEFTMEGLPKFTVSIGVAEYKKGESFEDWYERADRELYRAKNGGRNIVYPVLD